MKIFEELGSKVNFVDDNNVFVGYDMDQCCCEDADWFISDMEEFSAYEEREQRNKYDLESYSFDKTYFVEIEEPKGTDEGGMVRFKLIGENKPLYLHLYNSHNGYYSHGFKSTIDDLIWHIGCL